MTLAEVKTMLTGITGFTNKVAYYAWPEGQAPALPFICFLETGENTFSADGVVYSSAKQIQIELYTKAKSTTDEVLVETALTNNGLFYTKDETYLDDEKCWMITYSLEV